MHDLRTAIRRLLVILQTLPKKTLYGKKSRKRIANYRKLMKANADTRDLDVILSKVAVYDTRQTGKKLVDKVRKYRHSSLEQGLRVAKAMKDSSNLSIRHQKLSDSDLKRRFEKITRRQLSKIREELPKVLAHPEEKEKLHVLREETRKLRYLLELDQEQKNEARLKDLKSWQDILGNIHDSDIFIQYFTQSKLFPEIGSMLDEETVARNRNYEKFRSLARTGLKLAG